MVSSVSNDSAASLIAGGSSAEKESKPGGSKPQIDTSAVAGDPKATITKMEGIIDKINSLPKVPAELSSVSAAAQATKAAAEAELSAASSERKEETSSSDNILNIKV